MGGDRFTVFAQCVGGGAGKSAEPCFADGHHRRAVRLGTGYVEGEEFARQVKGEDASVVDGFRQAAEDGERGTVRCIGLDQPIAFGERTDALDYLAHVEQGRITTAGRFADGSVAAGRIAADGRPSRGGELAGKG